MLVVSRQRGLSRGVLVEWSRDMGRGLAGCLLGLVRCTGAVTDPVQGAPATEVPRVAADVRAAPAVRHASGEWPFLDRADYLDRLRLMGDSLQSKWFMLTRLSGWSVQAAKLGLRYDMPA